ncbi:MAG: hypothetical protein R3Y59_10030 [bacterium]
MKRLTNKQMLVAVLLCIAVGASAQDNKPRQVPATPHPIEVIQPNGDTLTIRLFGDERGSYRTTVDGYLIAENKRGKYCYARINKKGETKATKYQAYDIDKRKNCTKRLLEKMAADPLLKRF